MFNEREINQVQGHIYMHSISKKKSEKIRSEEIINYISIITLDDDGRIRELGIILLALFFPMFATL